MSTPRLTLALLALGLAAPAPRAADDAHARFAPTDRYETRQVRGWTVLVHSGLLKDQPDLARQALDLLEHHLYQISRVVPPAALQKIKGVRIWLEEREPHHPCMAYHPDPGWLREHDMNPDKARCVEIANARNFLDWTHKQPWMVLHELAHAYHHQSLAGGFDNAKVRDAFRRTKGAGLYNTLLHIDGHDRPGYAATNPMEYFAEVSEAYFGTNDFYPFVRAELRKHDPETVTLLQSLWNLP